MSDSPAVHPTARRKQLIKTLAGFIFPLFFVVVFPLAYVSALHNPTPNELQLTIVGPTAVVGKIADSLDKTNSFDVSQTDVERRARADVEQRASVGSILIGTNPETTQLSMTVFTADGGGRAAAAAVQGAASDIAKQLDVEPTVVDVAPLAERDVVGTNLFFLLTYSSIGAYLLIVILAMLIPNASFRVKYGAVLIASFVVPLFVFGVSSIFVGDYGATLQQVIGLLLIDALYVFTVGSLAILLQKLAGPAAVIVVMALVVFVNLPSSGGPMPASMLPEFWQWVHSFWFGAGAMESFRSVIYFGGAQAGRWVAQLAYWAALVTALSVALELFNTNRSLRRRLEGTQRHHQVEPEFPGSADPTVSEPPRSPVHSSISN